jgi:hypothetical protein
MTREMTPPARRPQRSKLHALGLCVLALVLGAGVLAACSGGSSSAKDTSDTQPLSAHPEPAGPNPSKSAQMVCAKEAQTEIASALSTHQTSVTTPTWRDHVYSCRYVYGTGSFTMSVKELVNAAATTAYYDGLEHRLGNLNPLLGLGQGGFLTKGGDAVVRKDYKVLLVDVHALPNNFATLTRAQAAQTIAQVILGCWSGE